LHCEALKRFLKGKELAFEEVDVTGKEDLIDDLIKMSGQMKMPITVVVNGKEKNIFCGFEDFEGWLGKLIGK
jgi:glutaredoxin